MDAYKIWNCEVQLSISSLFIEKKDTASTREMSTTALKAKDIELLSCFEVILAAQPTIF